MQSIFLVRNKLVLSWILIFFCIAVGIGISYAEEKYPSRDVNFIIPWGAGGVSDLTGRIFADELSKVMGVPVVPVNKPGGGGTIGTAFAAKSKQDGYTLLIGSTGGMVLVYHNIANVPFDTLGDFVPVCRIATSPIIIIVKKDSPFESFEQLIDYAKKNPGKLNYATAGIGADTHFFTEHLQSIARIKFTHVPYKGGGEVLTATLGGHVDFGITIVASASSQLKAEAMRGLVIVGEKRLSVFPNLPTTSEKGFSQHFINNWVGLFAPAGTPESVLNNLVSASEKTVKTKDFISRIENMGSSVAYLGPNEFNSFIKAELETANTVAKQIGIKPK